MGAPVAGAGPKSHRAHFTCLNAQCRAEFTTHTRRGIWATCPRCGERTYGAAALRDLAVAHTADSGGERQSSRRRGARRRPRAAASPSDRPPTTRASGFLSALLGASEDPEID